MTDSNISSLRPAKTTLLKKFERVFEDPVLTSDQAGKNRGPDRIKSAGFKPAGRDGIPETMKVYKQGGAVSEVNLSVIGSKFDTIA